MAAHARIKNEFTEDEKYNNLMNWVNALFSGLLSGYLYEKHTTDMQSVCHHKGIDLLLA